MTHVNRMIDESSLKKLMDSTQLSMYQHSIVWLGMMLVLVLVVIYMAYKMHKNKEKFNPTSTMQFQRMTGINEPATNAPTSTMSTPGGKINYIPGTSANNPASLDYQILHSPSFNCKAAGKPINGAWGWLNSAIHGSAGGSEAMLSVPTSDNGLTKILAGR